ncbi:MAG TPA: biotin/lipoyl-containing protein [Candidatus Limnocylindria bacterium]|nr:biotin/lipoyl-containing protein [Candidatus Limnocylindria bacterium]
MTDLPEMDPQPGAEIAPKGEAILSDEARARADAPLDVQLPPSDVSGSADPPAPANGSDASLLALIDRLSSLLDRSDLSELEVQVGGTGLVLRKLSALTPTVVATQGSTSPADGSAAPAGAPATSPGASDAAAAPAKPAVMAPLSGIWYGSPAPGTAPYVSLGGEVAVGQVIGLIEAMKLFNEIKSDKAGRVTKINAENGKLVRAKQPLIEVEPL